MTNTIVKCNCLLLKRQLLLKCLVLLVIGLGNSYKAFAHPSPNSLLFLDVSQQKVTLEIQMPVTELELAFGQPLSKDPSNIIKNYQSQLKEYLLAHIHAYSILGKQWSVNIINLKMNKGFYEVNNIPFWEVVAFAELRPNEGESSRNFYLDYDAIIHQVVNHAAMVTIRSDWENGRIDGYEAQARAISWDFAKNKIAPLYIQLDKGSAWKGFTSFIRVGMRHIQEGTDHMMFLLVLLIPSTLLVKNNRWDGFAGTKASLLNLLKTTASFTLGHSLTLFFGAIGWFKFPAQPIEILIAVSILVSAINAIKPLFGGKEAVIAGFFGLIHGFAFATSISNLNLDVWPMVISVLGFNIGIELMQLFIISLVMPWMIMLGRKSIYLYLRIAGSLVAIIASLGWIIQRISNRENIITNAMAQSVQYTWIIIGTFAVFAIFYSFFSPANKLKEINKGMKTH